MNSPTCKKNAKMKYPQIEQVHYIDAAVGHQIMAGGLHLRSSRNYNV